VNSKQSLRHSLRQARRSLTPAQQQQAALRLRHKLLRSHWFRRSHTIAFYWPADGEISPLSLLHPALRMGKYIYLPVIRQAALVFRRYRPGDRLYNNRYGIPEPSPRRPTLTVDELDLILVPLVGFDSHGNRLGMGAGFYDRCFSHLGARPWRIGIAHELQQIAMIPQDPWDKPLHGVVTDRRCYRGNRHVV
jgi:5-formyltetrahydrofolate cyclo-ligase